MSAARSLPTRELRQRSRRNLDKQRVPVLEASTYSVAQRAQKIAARAGTELVQAPSLAPRFGAFRGVGGVDV